MRIRRRKEHAGKETRKKLLPSERMYPHLLPNVRALLTSLSVLFRSGVAKRAEQPTPSQPATTAAKPAPVASKPSSAPPPKQSLIGKKDQKSILKGVIVKKKAKDKQKPKDKAPTTTASLPGSSDT